MQNSFQKRTQFSQRNDVLDPPASNADDFLTRDTELLPFSLIGLFGTKVILLTLENPER
jgi:hypothetical protein